MGLLLNLWSLIVGMVETPDDRPSLITSGGGCKSVKFFGGWYRR